MCVSSRFGRPLLSKTSQENNSSPQMSTLLKWLALFWAVTGKEEILCADPYLVWNVTADVSFYHFLHYHPIPFTVSHLSLSLSLFHMSIALNHLSCWQYCIIHQYICAPGSVLLYMHSFLPYMKKFGNKWFSLTHVARRHSYQHIMRIIRMRMLYIIFNVTFTDSPPFHCAYYIQCKFLYIHTIINVVHMHDIVCYIILCINMYVT